MFMELEDSLEDSDLILPCDFYWHRVCVWSLVCVCVCVDVCFCHVLYEDVC